MSKDDDIISCDIMICCARSCVIIKGTYVGSASFFTTSARLIMSNYDIVQWNDMCILWNISYYFFISCINIYHNESTVTSSLVHCIIFSPVVYFVQKSEKCI